MVKSMLAFAISLFMAFTLQAQSSIDTTRAYQKDWRLIRNGMLSLTGWATVNMGSALLLSHTDNQWGYFHQMNGLWNTVNFGLGAMGTYRAIRKLRKPDFDNHLRDMNKMGRVLKINGYVDIGYMAAGAGAWALANQFGNPAMAQGYGKSLLLQGAFLFVFDWAMFLLVKHHSTRYNVILQHSRNR